MKRYWFPKRRLPVEERVARTTEEFLARQQQMHTTLFIVQQAQIMQLQEKHRVEKARNDDDNEHDRNISNRSYPDTSDSASDWGFGGSDSDGGGCGGGGSGD